MPNEDNMRWIIDTILKQICYVQLLKINLTYNHTNHFSVVLSDYIFYITINTFSDNKIHKQLSFVRFVIRQLITCITFLETVEVVYVL